MLPLGGAHFTVDSYAVDVSKCPSHKGMMPSGVPNLALAIGYINASWTLKAELTSMYVCRLLNYMERRGYRQCTPRRPAVAVGERPLLDLSSGYVERSIDEFPKQGSRKPWRLYQKYLLYLLTLKCGTVDDAAMEFSKPEPRIVTRPRLSPVA